MNSHPVACEARSGSAALDGDARDEDAVEERAVWNGEHECFHERATAPERADAAAAGCGSAGATPRLAEVEAMELDSLSNAIAARDAANTGNTANTL